MKNAKAFLLIALLTTGCATQQEAFIDSRLGGNKQERVAALASECETVFKSSHVGPANNKKYGNIQWRRHEPEMVKLCDAMANAASGKGAGNASQLHSQCLNEKVIGGRIYSARNKTHIARKDALCNAFYGEIQK